ncbi:MAG TPA: hypothetical protein VN745_05250 [Verrucomicrobiae bacterium]|nr:hypothetical protein [Verrucomicrobiae bacterium]
MRKALAVIAVGATMLWLSASAAMAQGQSQNHTSHGASAAGSHEPMGMDHAMGGGPNNGVGKSSTATGSKTPDELLTQNTQLASKLQSLVPQGTDLQAAAASFKNLGQFVAAVHVSHNLKIPFACLASDMTGTAAANFAPSGTTVTCPDGTGAKRMTLGGSIKALDPSVDNTEAKQDAKTAMNQAKNDMKGSGK